VVNSLKVGQLFVGRGRKGSENAVAESSELVVRRRRFNINKE
jgi:hypothetical protein